MTNVSTTSALPTSVKYYILFTTTFNALGTDVTEKRPFHWESIGKQRMNETWLPRQQGGRALAARQRGGRALAARQRGGRALTARQEGG